MSSSLLLQKVKPELDDLARKYEYVMNIFEKMAGGEMVQFNNSFFLSEKTSMDRDFSLAYFMRENKCFPPGADIKKILEFYFQVGYFCPRSLPCNVIMVFENCAKKSHFQSDFHSKRVESL